MNPEQQRKQPRKEPGKQPGAADSSQAGSSSGTRSLKPEKQVHRRTVCLTHDLLPSVPPLPLYLRFFPVSRTPIRVGDLFLDFSSACLPYFRCSKDGSSYRKRKAFLLID